MENYKKSYKFRFIENRWRDTLNKEAKLLCDVLNELNIIIDDNLEYGRYKDYINNNYIIYRTHGGIIDIYVWDLNTHK